MNKLGIVPPPFFLPHGSYWKLGMPGADFGTFSGFDLGSGFARFNTFRNAAVLARILEWM